MRNKKIAFCISGQWRNNEKVMDRYLKFISKYNLDVYISIWNETGFYEKNKTVNVDLNNIKLCYKPKKIEIIQFKNEYFDKIGKTIYPETLKKLNKNQSSLPMYYLIHRCNELVKKYEIENDINYDFIIRSRPDLFIPSIKLFLNTKNNIYLSHKIRETYYSDQFAYGSYEAMNYYCDVFNRLTNYWDKENLINIQDSKNVPVGEKLMRIHLKNSNYSTREIFAPINIIRNNKSSNFLFNWLKYLYKKFKRFLF